MTVMGASLGALLPDVWDWEWLQSTAAPDERAAVAERVAARAAELEEAEARAVLGVRADASPEEVKHAWRAVLQRWHPDKAPDEASRAAYHVRFLAYKAAYERVAKSE
jgi:DnaJ-domain-containing protein 1